MKLYVIYDYQNRYPERSGKDLTDALIRECLCGHGGTDDPEDIVIRRTEKGKPYLSSDSHISVSHSQGTFAMIEANANIGLDIQYSRDAGVDRIAARLFTEDELAILSEDSTDNSFFRLWTRKEAYSKYTGMGMEQIMKKESVLDRSDVTFTDLRLADGCFCAICTGKEGGLRPDEIQISYRK